MNPINSPKVDFYKQLNQLADDFSKSKAPHDLEKIDNLLTERFKNISPGTEEAPLMEFKAKIIEVGAEQTPTLQHIDNLLNGSIFMDLPPEIIEHILSYLGSSDVKNVSLVHSLLNQMMSTPTLLANLVKQDIERFTPDTLLKLAPKISPYIKELNFPRQGLRSGQLQALIKAYPKLEKLGLGKYAISQDNLPLLKEIKNLKSLSISDFTIVDTFSPEFAAKLEELTLNHCNLVCEDDALTRFASHLTNLKKLNLTHFRAGREDTFFFTELGKHCKQLQDVRLSNCTHLSNDGFAGFATAFKNVKKLSLENIPITGENLKEVLKDCTFRELQLIDCKNLTDEGFAIFTQALKECRTLNLRGCTLLKGSSFKELAMCQTLKNVDLTHCTLLTNQSIQDLAPALKSAKFISLMGCKKLTDTSLQSLSGCNQLEELWLNDMSKITDKGFIALIPTFKDSIKMIGIAGTLLSKKILPELKTCTKLKNIMMEDCPNISDEDMKEFGMVKQD